MQEQILAMSVGASLGYCYDGLSLWPTSQDPLILSIQYPRALCLMHRRDGPRRHLLQLYAARLPVEVQSRIYRQTRLPWQRLRLHTISAIVGNL